MSSALRHPLPGDASRATPEVRLSVEQVSYAYAPNPSQAPLFTLEAMSFQARPGELVAILGPNASGKSTLLKLISGSLAPLSGRIFLNGFETHSLPVKTRAQRIALVQQESRLLFPSRAWEFVMQGRHPYGGGLRFESEEDILIANNALAQVGAAELADRWMDKISGGEKQRVILARALAQEYRLPFQAHIDENSLDSKLVSKIPINYAKKNRLLPRGWKPTGPHAAETKPHGAAASDPDYLNGCGCDTIIYRIPLGKVPNAAKVRAQLFYQTIPPYYLHQRFTDTYDPSTHNAAENTQRLMDFVARLNVGATEIHEWKLLVAGTTHSITD